MPKRRIKGSPFNPCAGASLEEGTKTAAIVQVVFTFAYVIHGGFLCIASGKYSLIYGLLYIASGISFFSLAYLLYTTVDQPSMACFRWWIISSSLTQTIVILATVTRNVLEEKLVWSVNVWITVGFLIHCYLVWIVLAYMKYGDDEDGYESDEEDWKPEVKPPSSSPPLPPPAASTNPPENDTDDNYQNDNDTVVIESADETETSKITFKNTDENATNTKSDTETEIPKVTFKSTDETIGDDKSVDKIADVVVDSVVTTSTSKTEDSPGDLQSPEGGSVA